MTNQFICDATCSRDIGIEDAWENVQAHSGRRENTMLARLTRWANSTTPTLACSRGIQLIGPHFM
jgi:hypothetical protein